MKCVFVGSLKEDSGYIVEVLQEKEYEVILPRAVLRTGGAS